MAQSDVRTIEKGEEKPKRRFDARDWTYIAEYICEEYHRRKQARKDLERIWKEIDRQLRMEPDSTHKLDAQGRVDTQKAWLPETELPPQATTLEILTADARRMLSPDSGLWFEACAALTDEYLNRVDFSSLITGDENEVPSKINQDNADKLAAGIVDHWHRQYDFWSNLDLINAEAFKYSVGVGRGRIVTKRVFMKTARGVVKQTQRIPVLFPRSIKNTYLDDSPHALMNEGLYIGPATIFEKTQRYEDLVLAASRGSSDPESEDGGWMPKNLKGIEGDEKGNVQLLEFEGDLIVPRKTVGSIYIPGAIVTVCIGKKSEKTAQCVVRFRFRKYNFSSYLLFPYHAEHIDTPYATAPLMKGCSVQKAAVESLNQLIMSAALRNRPPVSYDKDDMAFAQSGGPQIFPGAQWASTGEIKVHKEVGGDPQALFAVYTGFLQQHADVTGVNAPRLGAQTVSHTTAYAKDAELSRGVVRTVDYVKATLKGPLTQWLYMAYEMGRDVLTKNTDVYIEPYDGFVTISKEHLPDTVVFTAHGAGGPQEEQAKVARRLQAMQMAIGMEQFRAQSVMIEAQTGMKPHINIEAAQEQVLREGGWTDLDAIIQRTESVPAGPPSEPPMVPGTEAVATAPGAALQALETL